MLRIARQVFIAVAIVCSVTLSTYGADDVRKRIDVPAGELSAALASLAKQAGVELIYQSDEIAGIKTKGVSGNLTAKEAVSLLLDGTPLTVRTDSSGAMLIGKPRTKPDAPVGASQMGLILAQAGSSSGDVHKAESITVTAQKRSELLIDVPQSVTVLSAADLAKLDATQFRDFANTVPGLTFTTSGAGYTQVSLRGVTTGFDISPTVGVYIDEVPYGSSGPFAFGPVLALDVGLFDLDRIEVLRGPQGTLYGASTMGGLIKYVPRRPDANSFGGDAQASISGTQHGGVNFNVAAAVNVPIVTDKAAVRVSGFESRDGGFIDNVASGQKGVNRSDIYGGRIDALFTPTNALSIRIDGFLQNISRDGPATVDYTLDGVAQYGSLKQHRLFVEPFDQHFRLVSGTVAYDFGPETLTSISSYQTARTQLFVDGSAFYVPLLASFGLPYGALGFQYGITTDRFTQEVRLASTGNKTLEWLIGGYYTHESSQLDLSTVTRDLAGQLVPNNIFTAADPSRFVEYAAFGNATYHLNSKFGVTGGIRYAHDDLTYSNQNDAGIFAAPKPARRSSERVLTYLANARYHFSDRAIGYLRYATGYRPGGPNFVGTNPATGQPVGPETFQADKLKSYEAGYKAESADHRFGIDLATYYIDWSNIQINAVVGGFSVIANAPGGATVRGAELTLIARPVSALTMTGAFAYQNAYLRQADAALGASPGERLPNVPRFTAAVNADYEIQVAGLRPTVGATLRYVTDRMASFGNYSAFSQYRLPAYSTLDLRAGVVLNKVNLHLYARNLFDKRGQLSAYTGYGNAQVAVLQPRTIGITAKVHF